MNRLIWICAVYKSLLLSPVAVKELKFRINMISSYDIQIIQDNYGKALGHFLNPFEWTLLHNSLDQCITNSKVLVSFYYNCIL